MIENTMNTYHEMRQMFMNKNETFKAIYRSILIFGCATWFNTKIKKAI